MSPEHYTNQLSPREINAADIQATGNYILNIALELSNKTNMQLLEPISKWIDDPDFMERHSAKLADKVDWACYKRKQRNWSRMQKLIAAERLRLFWRDIQSRKNIKKEIGRILNGTKFRGNNKRSMAAVVDDNFLSSILKPFSPDEQKRRETQHQFNLAENLSPSEILPWKIILRHQIQSKVNFEDLPQFLPDKIEDKTAKFINLLHIESMGHIEIYQNEPFGQVSIQPRKIDAAPEGSFIIKDRNGEEYRIDWKDLSDAQRDKVIADGLNNKIICKSISGN